MVYLNILLCKLVLWLNKEAVSFNYSKILLICLTWEWTVAKLSDILAISWIFCYCYCTWAVHLIIGVFRLDISICLWRVIIILLCVF